MSKSKWGNDPYLVDFWRAWRGAKAARGMTGNQVHRIQHQRGIPSRYSAVARERRAQARRDRKRQRLSNLIQKIWPGQVEYGV